MAAVPSSSVAQKTCSPASLAWLGWLSPAVVLTLPPPGHERDRAAVGDRGSMGVQRGGLPAPRQILAGEQHRLHLVIPAEEEDPITGRTGRTLNASYQDDVTGIVDRGSDAARNGKGQ